VPRSTWSAVLFVLALATVASADPTRCRERELPLDAHHSVALLEGCGEEYDTDLLWHLDRIDQVSGELDGHFDRRNSGAGSVVYVMDTGVLAGHLEFDGRVVAGYDVSGSVPVGSSDCISQNKALAPCASNYEELAPSSHGTSVASIIAGRNVGVAPQATIVSIRVMNERGLATTEAYMNGLDAIIAHAWASEGPRTSVVNISGWVLERLSSFSSEGPVVPFSQVEQKIRRMIAGVDRDGQADLDGKRFLFVVAGNNIDGGCGTAGFVDRFPAVLGRRTDGLISVGGITAQNGWWSGGCKGGVEVLAPAQGIFSATITGPDHYRGRRPNMRSGTSFAAPIISGIAARMLAERPDLTPQQLEAWITTTPSRISNPSRLFAEGKVAIVRSLAPRVAANVQHVSR
jgi:subtilisin family serine protease